ncbi:MAG: hypothetical protein WC378_04880 [Opitutaceae bacterium]|jgi:hypothetical protein
MSTKLSPPITKNTHLANRAAPLSLAALFGEQLDALYGLVQRSDYVFGSPLGPFQWQSRTYYVPRFVYFGPNASDAAVRLAFLSGFDHRDLRGTLALLHFVEQLALRPDIGQGLNLSFFPLIDVLGLSGASEERALVRQSWTQAVAPEIDLLEKDSRLRSYHGFVRVESAPGDDAITVRLRTPAHEEHPTPGVELIDSNDVAPFMVRWETASVDASADGPLTIADDQPFHPFELTLRIPAAWPAELYREAVASILKRFVLRYRGIVAYGQHL